MFFRPFFLNVWSFLDPIYFIFTRLQYPCPGTARNGVFRVRLTRYKGKDVILSDGTKICKNDLLLKIHLHNVKILKELSSVKSEIAKGRVIFKQVLKSMPFLASFISGHPEHSRIKGVIGITLIDKGFTPLGFDCIHPENRYYLSFKKATQLPIYLLSCSEISMANIRKHHPVYLMMSKEMLLEKYKRSI
nr:hypothetical protein [Bacillus sp. FJAT-27251]